MKELIEGVLRFQNEVYPRDRAVYQKLAAGQSPRWLLIACSDSRVVPSTLAQMGPGELFICRNAGNMVPAHSDHSGGVSATIEFAVQALKVKHVIVCGHSDCGVMKALLHPEAVAELPAVARWMSYGERARAVVRSTGAARSDIETIAALTEENVLAQLDNLRTLPCVAAALRAGRLDLHGWVYDIARGRFTAWDPTEGRWRPIDELAPRWGVEAASQPVGGTRS
jgi:carbonic anhydrase